MGKRRQAAAQRATTAEAIQLVKDGDMTATVWQPAYQEGKAMFQSILELDRGREILAAQDHCDPGNRRDQG